MVSVCVLLFFTLKWYNVHWCFLGRSAVMLSAQFFSFFGNISQITGWRPTPLKLASTPPSEKSWISHWCHMDRSQYLLDGGVQGHTKVKVMSSSLMLPISNSTCKGKCNSSSCVALASNVLLKLLFLCYVRESQDYPESTPVPRSQLQYRIYIRWFLSKQSRSLGYIT